VRRKGLRGVLLTGGADSRAGTSDLLASSGAATSPSPPRHGIVLQRRRGRPITSWDDAAPCSSPCGRFRRRVRVVRPSPRQRRTRRRGARPRTGHAGAEPLLALAPDDVTSVRLRQGATTRSIPAQWRLGAGPRHPYSTLVRSLANSRSPRNPVSTGTSRLRPRPAARTIEIRSAGRTIRRDGVGDRNPPGSAVYVRLVPRAGRPGRLLWCATTSTAPSQRWPSNRLQSGAGRSGPSPAHCRSTVRSSADRSRRSRPSTTMSAL